MKLSFALSALVVAVLAAVPARAQNYPWCAQYSGRMGGAMNCGFVSFDQCMNTVRGMGGFCIENNTYHPPAGRTYRSQRKKKASHHS
ncbi:MAG TPA: DUF3551 domain-containing protein [Xanthobacteraceae bacterium]|jgi:hypothetical protein|nr:DUF3551 domain-containing protein [Xanthobacteraceae bacterium]